MTSPNSSSYLFIYLECFIADPQVKKQLVSVLESLRYAQGSNWQSPDAKVATLPSHWDWCIHVMTSCLRPKSNQCFQREQISLHCEFSVFLLQLLKIRSRSPKSNKFFVVFKLYIHETLVRIQPLVHNILCRQEFVCFEVLLPRQPNVSCCAWSVYLTNTNADRIHTKTVSPSP